MGKAKRNRDQKIFERQNKQPIAIHGTGVQYEARSAVKGIMDPGPGKHYWVVIATWGVADPASKEIQHMDMENLLDFAGPGCFKCEQEYTAAIDANPCRVG